MTRPIDQACFAQTDRRDLRLTIFKLVESDLIVHLTLRAWTTAATRRQRRRTSDSGPAADLTPIARVVNPDDQFFPVFFPVFFSSLSLTRMSGELQGLELFSSARSRDASDDESFEASVEEPVLVSRSLPPLYTSAVADPPLPPPPTCCCSITALSVWVGLLVLFNVMGLSGMVFGIAWTCATCPLAVVYIGLCSTANRNMTTGGPKARAFSLWAILYCVLSFVALVVGVVLLFTTTTGAGNLALRSFAFTNDGDGAGTVVFGVLMTLLFVVGPAFALYWLCCRTRSRAPAQEPNLHSV